MSVSRWVRVGMGMSAAWIAGAAITVTFADMRAVAVFWNGSNR
jgi:hypothetical protein